MSALDWHWRQWTACTTLAMFEDDEEMKTLWMILARAHAVMIELLR